MGASEGVCDGDEPIDTVCERVAIWLNVDVPVGVWLPDGVGVPVVLWLPLTLAVGVCVSVGV